MIINFYSYDIIMIDFNVGVVCGCGHFKGVWLMSLKLVLESWHLCLAVRLHYHNECSCVQYKLIATI